MTDGRSMILAVLAFLAAGGLVLLSLGLTAWFAIRGRRRTARVFALAGAATAGLYCLVLAGASLASRERVLAPGQEKYFCEVDCHLAYVVTEVQSEEGASEAPGDAGSADRRWVITVRTRFDETTISARRSRTAPLQPGSRRVALVGSDGRRYQAVDQPGEVSPTTAFNQPLRPGESYQTVLRFTLPEEVTPARLLLEDDMEISRLLIGHERSPGHAPIALGLQLVNR